MIRCSRARVSKDSTCWMRAYWRSTSRWRRLGVGLDRLHGGGHHGGVLGVQEHAGAAHGLGDGGGPEGHHRDAGGHGLEDGHPESLVLAHRHEDPGPGEGRPQQGVGDLAHHDHVVVDPEAFGLGPHRVHVVGGPGVPHQHQARLPVEGGAVVREGGDQVALALVADDPAHVQPVGGGRGVGVAGGRG